MLRPGLTECRRSAARCLAGLVIVAVCGAVSSRALCAENDKVVARAHYETATRIYDLREYAKALDEYKAAYLAKSVPSLLFNIGQCFRKLGRESEDDPFAKPDKEAARAPQSVPSAPPETPPPPNAVSAPTRIPLPAAPEAVPPSVPSQPEGVALTSPPPTQVGGSPPIYSTWWFWTGVGAVVVAGTITVIMLSKGGSEPNTATTTLGTQAAFP